jgi:hypothetical protein
MKMNKFSEEYRLAQRWFPSGSMAINHPDGLGVAYVSLMTPEKDYWQVVAYRGTAGKPGFHDLNEPEEQHKATGASVTFRFGSGSKWDGKPRYCSWYA